MVILETLTLQVGSVIAKTILKVWLKDKEIETEIGIGILDMLKFKGADVLAQQRGRRQFEEIGEKVVENLLPAFDESTLNEGSKVAVSVAVAETIDQTNVTSAVIANNNLDPSELTNHFLDLNPNATNNFSNEEMSLYHYILKESADYIIDISSQFPNFTERTFSEILKRENLLLNRADEILNEVRQIRKESRRTNIEENVAQFEEEYRRAVVRNLDKVELFGVDVSSPNRRYRLSVAYVSLSIAQKKLDKEISSTYLLEQKTSPSSLNKEIDCEENDRLIIAVEDVLMSSPKLILHGQAGSGKTTLIKWIAVNSAGRTFKKQLTELNDCIPFIIFLRQCVEAEFPAPELFPRMVAPAIAGKMPEQWVHNCLDSGRAIILIDGVDEIPQIQRPQVHTWLKELVDTYDKARFIVTTRPNAVEEEWLDKEGFDDAEIQMMELPEINKFIDHWHNAVREELQHEEEKERLDDLKRNLKEIIKLNRSIHNLASSPLLCAVLCALHRDRNQELPSDRIEIYEAICYMLLERRTKEQHLIIETKDYPQLNYRQKRTLLEELAYRMMINSWSMVKVERFDQILEQKLENMETLAKYKTSEIRRLFIERSGMIQMPITRQIDFIHRTFQEFLAAKAAIDNIDTGLLASKANDDQWREVIILAAGLASKKIREELICNIIERGDKEYLNRHQLHLLAVACLETSVELSPDVLDEVRKRLSRLVPPTNITEAKALSSAEDLAVPYIKYDSRYNSTEAVACVRCLSLIGSDSALYALKSYKKEWRQTVLRELFKAADSFDIEYYGHEVLSNLTTKYLSLEHFSSLNKIHYMTHLTKLELFDRNEQISDLSPLSNLTNLTWLKLLYLPKIKSISSLSNLTKLSILYISRCEQINDFSPLSNLTNLTELNIVGCSQIDDFSLLTNLTKLNLSNSPQINDLSPLSNLINLTKLNLSNCTQINDLSPLSNLTNLTELHLWNCPLINDLSPLIGLKHLKRLFNIPKGVTLPDEIAQRLSIYSQES